MRARSYQPSADRRAVHRQATLVAAASRDAKGVAGTVATVVQQAQELVGDISGISDDISGLRTRIAALEEQL